MNVMHGNIGGMFKMLPGVEQGVAQPGIEEAGPVMRGGNFGKQFFEPRENALAAGAGSIHRPGSACRKILRVRVGGNPPDRRGLKTPIHISKSRVCSIRTCSCAGKEPEQVAAADLVFAVGQQIEAGARVTRLNSSSA